MKQAGFKVPGCLVAFPVTGATKPLDGFLCRGAARSKKLLIYVHGMHSNFYSSELRKCVMRQGLRSGFHVLLFNNRGAESATDSERFRDCLADIDAAIGFARQEGYREFVLVGHSTGCQKITYYQAVRKRKDVKGLVLLAIGDDYAIARRDLGRKFHAAVRLAKQRVARGKGDGEMRWPGMPQFTARRFLSIADRKQVESKLFDLEGRLMHFGRLRCPVLVVLAGEDEYETMSPRKAIEALLRRYQGSVFSARIIPGADHSFRGDGAAVASLVCGWAAACFAKRSIR